MPSECRTVPEIELTLVGATRYGGHEAATPSLAGIIRGRREGMQSVCPMSKRRTGVDRNAGSVIPGNLVSCHLR